MGVKVELKDLGKMRASITGGFWALILGGAGVATVSIMAGPPESTSGVVAPDVAIAMPAVDEPEPVAVEAEETVVVAAVEPAPETAIETVVEPTMEAPEAVVEPVVAAMAEATNVPDTSTTAPDLDVALAAPADDAAPATPAASQSPMTGLLEAGELQEPDAPDALVVDTQSATPAPVALAQATETVIETVQEAEVAPATVPAATAPAPQATPAAATQTAQASQSVSTPRTAPVAPTRVQADGGSDVALDEGAVEDVTTEDARTPNSVPADNLSPDAPAVLRFAAAFDNPEGLPVVAVVLLDDGTLTDGPAQVLQSGIVATVAINALMDDATLWAEAYREAGAEVAMQVPLPDRATPSDVEVAFAAALEILPEAGLLFSDGTGVLRNDRLAAAQVMQILASEGRGLVTIQQGLGSLIRAAERAEVRVATVSRDVDGAGESNSAILRALDQAAFRARQSGGAVIVARLKPRTMDVLSIWARDAASDGILMGPVSALIVDRSEFLVEEPVEGEDATAEGGSELPTISQ